MTAVVLDHVWMNLASDPSDFRDFPLMSELSITTTKPGSVREYANGRRRIVKRKGKGRGISVSLPLCDRDRVEWLDDHVGDLVCVRDDRGRKVWGVYFATDVSEHDWDPEYAAVSIELHEVSHSEEV